MSLTRNLNAVYLNLLRFGLSTLVCIGTQSQARAQTEAEGLAKSFRDASRRVLPAVVTVRSVGAPGIVEPVPGFLSPDPRMPSRPDLRALVPNTGGSGLVIDAGRGLVLTNDHVVPDAPRIVVTLPDGRERTVRRILRDPASDLALLMIDPEDLTQATWGDSEILEIGDWVLAIGQPFGLTGTVTAGIVSGRRRGLGVAMEEDLIQTDAAINAGSSGGPLVNVRGEVVGINIAIKTVGGGHEGVSFAVPSFRARRIASDLAGYGRVRRAQIGVAVEKADPELVHRAGQIGGVTITSVLAGRSAAIAGLRPGDIILKVGNNTIESSGSLRSAIEFAPTDTTIKLVFLRDAQVREVQVQPTLGYEPNPRTNASGSETTRQGTPAQSEIPGPP